LSRQKTFRSEKHATTRSDIHFEKEVMLIKVYVFPLIPIVIIAALAFLSDRAMEYSLIRREATLTVIIVSLLTLLVLVLLIYLQRKHKNRERRTGQIK
jgi:heme/copper-type cytochrome/quinol oxidase subunit 2